MVNFWVPGCRFLDPGSGFRFLGFRVGQFLDPGSGSGFKFLGMVGIPIFGPPGRQFLDGESGSGIRVFGFWGRFLGSGSEIPKNGQFLDFWGRVKFLEVGVKKMTFLAKIWKISFLGKSRFSSKSAKKT